MYQLAREKINLISNSKEKRQSQRDRRPLKKINRLSLYNPKRAFEIITNMERAVTCNEDTQ